MNINKSIRFFLALLWLAPIGLHAQQRQDSIGTKMPGIVAHRGFHQFESSAENSISALQTAVSIGFEGSEFDVQLTSDDMAIVFHDACMMMSQLMPDVPVAYLEGDLSPRQLHEMGITGIDYHYGRLEAHPEWVKEAHDIGMTVNVWTVNKPEKAQEMLRLGVDYITTDYPFDMRNWIAPEP